METPHYPLGEVVGHLGQRDCGQVPTSRIQRFVEDESYFLDRGGIERRACGVSPEGGGLQERRAVSGISVDGREVGDLRVFGARYGRLLSGEQRAYNACGTSGDGLKDGEG